MSASHLHTESAPAATEPRTTPAATPAAALGAVATTTADATAAAATAIATDVRADPTALTAWAALLLLAGGLLLARRPAPASRLRWR